MEVIFPSSASATMSALPSPEASKAISRAPMMVAMPMVTARAGTFSSPKNALAASSRVTESSTTKRVRDSSALPGSLKPM